MVYGLGVSGPRLPLINHQYPKAFNRQSFEKSFEDATLLEDLGGVSLSGVSELWWERGKGSWGAK